MAILVGIDEAGYGPLLGPLVVSSAAFSISDEHLKSDLWKLLSRAVAVEKKQLAGRLLITDSKKAYNKSTGVKYLRRTVLASLKCCCGNGSRPDNPPTAGELLERLCPHSAERLGDYPWYETLGDTELGGDSSDIAIAAAVLNSTLGANKMELLDMSSHCLDVGYYNKMVSAVKNKANVLFTSISSLIKQAYDDYGDRGNLQIIIDQQGGRVHYRKILGQMFPELELKIIRQGTAGSSYELTGNGKTMRLHFAVKADVHFLPVCLASMTSKYVREVLINSLNRYFLSHCQELKPTAGYWKDGTRFIKDIQTNLPNLEYNREKLVRSR